MTRFGDDHLPCPVCGQPVDKGDWFILANEAIERVRNGTPNQGVPQRPVHLTCIQNAAKRPVRVMAVHRQAK